MRYWLRMKNSNNRASFYDWCKILFPVISAAMVAATGAYYTYQSAFNNTAKDYVKIGVDILTSSDDKYDVEIKQWAAQLVDHYSPVKWGDVVESKIISGFALKSKEPGIFASEFEKNLSKKFSSYELNWEQSGNFGYKVEVEESDGEEWVLFNALSTANNSTNILVPKGTKIRWRVVTYALNGSDEKTTKWKYIK
ncbi:hypothetical protein GA102_04885 [Vibrio alginolyticus]|uniref:hypothetical protein n=1 Tax=Vibrio alginolyticus TaxID=663 RepID=UPI00215C9E72|nr:hypothetical protein [Vibrio alginolyticus]EGQ9096002.1 hypothetical protein [Vibrio alginolyticus]MCR9487320.1 hypothetical protein [Vibrio alginolyticus]